MKKVFLGLIGVIVFILLQTSAYAQPEDFQTYGDFQYMEATYTEDDNDVIIVGYIGSSSDITIPSEINGYTVSSIVQGFDGGVFNSCEYPFSLTLPNTMTSISVAFFGCKYITSVNIPEGIENLHNAFTKCTSLTSANIPASATDTLGAFSGCVNLSNMTISNGIKELGDAAFSDCTSLSSISIPASVKRIGAQTFAKCTSLSSLVIPDSVNELGVGAFYGCNNLTSLTVPDSVITIGQDAFRDCPNLTIYCNKGSVIEQYASRNGLNYVADGISSHQEPTVSGPLSEDVHMGYNLLSDGTIEITSYNNRDPVATLTIPSTIDGYLVTKLGGLAFNSRHDIEIVQLPASLTTIGSDVFSGCDYLRGITIPDSVTSISEYAFTYCDNLVISCTAGSYAEQYAIDNNIRYTIVDPSFMPEPVIMETKEPTVSENGESIPTETINPDKIFLSETNSVNILVIAGVVSFAGGIGVILSKKLRH